MAVWKKISLDKLVSFQRGHDLTVASLVPGPYEVAGSNGPIGSHNMYTTKGPGITLGRSGNSIGVVHFYENDFWAHNTTLYSKEFHNCDPKFIYYLLKTVNLSGHNSGSAVPSLNRNHIASVELNVPDIETQRQIASILSSLDEKIALNRRMNQTLEQIAATLFKKYFVEDIDPENLPEGWRWGTLSEVADFSNGYAFSSKDLLDADNGNCYHVFKMGHITRGGGFNSEGTKSYFEKVKASGIQKYVLKKGDLLMCMTDMKDSMALLGHTALMPVSDKYIVNQRVGLLRTINCSGIGYPFLYMLTNSDDFIENLRSRANSGVQVNLSTNEIKNSRIIIPSKPKAEEFDKNVNLMFEKMFIIISENAKLIELRDSLLPKLLSGELDPTTINQNEPLHAEIFS